MSRSTFFARLKAGASVTELFKAARTKSKPITLSHDDFDYSPAAFAAEFGLSRKHVQNGIAAALSPEQIINAPPPKKRETRIDTAQSRLTAASLEPELKKQLDDLTT